MYKRQIYEHAESLIAHSCQVKRKMVVEDELDQGIRLYLNFGHTLGHAIEATAGYGQVMHGEAVAIGMVQEMCIRDSNNPEWVKHYSFTHFSHSGKF